MEMKDGTNDVGVHDKVSIHHNKTIELRTLNQDQFEELLRLSAGNLHISTPSETTTMKPSSSK